MEIDVTHASPTLLGRLYISGAGAMNRYLRDNILVGEGDYASLGSSNIGGWHSRRDFLNRLDPPVSALRVWLTGALRRMINATAGVNADQPIYADVAAGENGCNSYFFS